MGNRFMETSGRAGSNSGIRRAAPCYYPRIVDGPRRRHGENMAGDKKTHGSPRNTKKTALPTVFLWITVFGLWLAWSGPLSFEHPFLLAMGVVSASGVTFLCRRMGLVDSEITPLHLTLRTLCYVPWLTWQVIISCWEVLRLGLAPSSREQPRVTTLLAGQKTSLGLVSYANSITLTPGTLSIDTDATERTIRVHAFSESSLESLQTGEMDRWVRWVEKA